MENTSSNNEMTLEEKLTQPYVIAIAILGFSFIVLAAMKLGKQEAVKEWNWVEISFPVWVPATATLIGLIVAKAIDSAKA